MTTTPIKNELFQIKDFLLDYIFNGHAQIQKVLSEEVQLNSGNVLLFK